MRLTDALQETLDALRQAMINTRIMCAVMLDTKVRALPTLRGCPGATRRVSY